MPVVKVTYSEEDIQLLDRDANQQGTSRAELIRQRTLTRHTTGAPFTTAEYHRVVANAHQFTRGSIDRLQVESLVAFVLNQVMA
jgi:hypothetical protein